MPKSAIDCAQAEYRAFLRDLSREEPAHGFRDATDLPPNCLTDAHRALILWARPDLMNRLDLNPLVLGGLIAQPQTSLGHRDHRLGMHLAEQLEAAIAHQLVSDLQEACDARHQEDAWDAQSERRTSLTPEQGAALNAGVASLFRGEL